MKSIKSFEQIDISTLGTQALVVDPELATRLLSFNKLNRPLSRNRVTTLAKAMLRGEWRFNGEAIKLSNEGTLLDGQHRLSAVVESGRPITTQIVYGLPEDVFHTLDSGKVRTTGDVLATMGEKNGTNLAASLKLLFNYLKYSNPASHEPVTKQQLINLLHENPDLPAYSNKYCCAQWTRKFVGASVATFCSYVFDQKYPGLGTQFFEALESGSNLEKDSPVLALRERLILAKESKTTKTIKGFKIALIFSAFRAYQSGTPLKRIRIVTAKGAPDNAVFTL